MYEPYGAKEERNFRSAIRPAHVQLSEQSSQVTREQDSRMSQLGAAEEGAAAATAASNSHQE